MDQSGEGGLTGESVVELRGSAGRLVRTRSGDVGGLASNDVQQLDGIDGGVGGSEDG